ncbi:hypothetical protein K6119_04225 [Paracrocinitomix mangrovi]|uniref:hypothetical protein n=1 Tax=Paracrocinitomix mangrovi TaxID=2862509 RepID=UPI001C8DD6DE|nr:hypothetical protein [Paracrocinitomix mangrovi]UKN02720.1 hypothetical protein K6119_04225 [Paracrocinitomix mangrovi]
MLRIIFFPFIFLYSLNSFCQLNDCEEIFDLYNVDSALYANLYSPSYCEGVIESYNKSIPTYLIPESNICTYWALEKNGIKIVENDLDIAPLEFHEQTTGFNFTTKLRVKNDLNLDFDSLCKIDTSWIELEDYEFAKLLIECFDFTKNDSGKTIMYLNKDKVTKSSFKTMNGTEFTIKRTKERFQYVDLIAGIELTEVDLQNGIIYLEFHFENYTNPNNVCLLRYTGYSVPIRVEYAP